MSQRELIIVEVSRAIEETMSLLKDAWNVIGAAADRMERIDQYSDDGETYDGDAAEILFEVTHELNEIHRILWRVNNNFEE